MTHPCQPVGARDIADRLRLKPNTIAIYKTRGMLPPPRWHVSNNPAWCWEHDIEPTLIDGRLPPSSGESHTSAVDQ
jgi:hypothetical protein